MPGFPIRTSTDQSLVGNSPWLFAASHVLLRLQAPRHPPLALCSLENSDARARYGVLKGRAARRRRSLGAEQEQPDRPPSDFRDSPRLTWGFDRTTWTESRVVSDRLGVLDRAVRKARTGRPRLLRKEVIQPHLPVRLPCYDLTPITDPTFDGSLHKWLGDRLRVLPTFVV